MKITDPISDMLTRIRNANSAGKGFRIHAIEQGAR